MSFRRVSLAAAASAAAWFLVPACALAAPAKPCTNAEQGVTQSPSGALSGCVQLGLVKAGNYTASLPGYGFGTPVPGASAPPRTMHGATVSLSPAAGPPGTVVTVSVTLRKPLDPKRVMAGCTAGVSWDGLTEGLCGQPANVRWISNRLVMVRVTVPSAPWINPVSSELVEGIHSGEVPIAADCLSDSGKCPTTAASGSAMFRLEVKHPPRWCRTASSCGALKVTPRSQASGGLVRVSGHAPIQHVDVGPWGFGSRLQLTHRSRRGPRLWLGTYRGESDIFVGRVAISLTRPPAFADLKTVRPIGPVIAGGARALAADPRDSRVVAWCGQGTIGLSVDGRRSAFSTVAAAPLLIKHGLKQQPAGAPPSCAAVTPVSPTTIDAQFVIDSGATRGTDPIIALMTDDAGRSWSASGRDTRPACPTRGACVTLAPYRSYEVWPSPCSISVASQPVVFSLHHGRVWEQPATLGGLPDPCGEVEFYATGPHTELLINSRSSVPVQRSTDGGVTWDYVGLPKPLWSDADSSSVFGWAPYGITVLPTGALLLTLDGAQQTLGGWQLLEPRARRWCAVAGDNQAWQSTAQASPITPIGSELWWLADVRRGIRVMTVPLRRVGCATGHAARTASAVARAASAVSSVPAGFRAASFTAIDTRNWWISGTIPCRFRHRCLGLVDTLNGGRSFARVPLPTLVAVEANSNPSIAFADRNDGYLAGSRFWVTHDRGRHWTAINLGGQVGSVATGGGFVYATVGRDFPRAVLMRSPVGHDDWIVLYGALDGFEGVSVDHGTVLLDESVTLGGEQRILISHDQGANFTYSRPLPEVICNPDEPVPGTVWMLCSGGMTDLLFRSTDGGREFSQPDWNGNPKDAPSLAGLSHSTLGAADATTAVIGSQELLRTTDGGRVFKRLPMPLAASGWDVAFIDSRHGLALGEFGESAYPPGRLYYTSNGGKSYRRIPIG